MRRPGRQDILIVITSPMGIGDPAAFSPFDAPDPDDLVFCCFFRTLDQRTEFLQRMRTVAGTRPEAGTDLEALGQTLAGDYTRLYQEGQAGEAFMAAIRWRTSVQQRGYHVYSLKIGFEPYHTSCVISFDEMETEILKLNLARALRFMEREKSRVLDAFGLGGMGGLGELN